MSTEIRVFWWLLLGVLLVSSATTFAGLWNWPWDIDEVATLQEMGRYRTDSSRALGSGTQLQRLPRAIPVWYWFQRRILDVLPTTEGNTRILSASCAILTVVISYGFSVHRYGLSFAVCLALLMTWNPLFLAQAQQNRCYPMAVLWLAIFAVVVLRDGTGRATFGSMILASAVGAITVLSHALTLVVLGFVLVASAIGWRAGWVSRGAFVRASVATCAGVLIYLGYIRPILAGWNEALPPRSHLTVILSFISEVGVPTIAFAIVGAAARPDPNRPSDIEFRWWTVLAALCLGFVVVGPEVIWFNYRYGLFFALPFCVLAARGVVVVGARLKLRGGFPVHFWYLCVLLLLSPKLLSHFVDGSRRDFRTAASQVEGVLREGEPLYCNWRELSYYLPEIAVRNWDAKTVFPPSVCYVVRGGNVWDRPLTVEGRITEFVLRIGRKRFDEQSNVVDVFRILSDANRIGPGTESPLIPKAEFLNRNSRRH